MAGIGEVARVQEREYGGLGLWLAPGQIQAAKLKAQGGRSD